MSTSEGEAGTPIASALVCHREALTASATAAALERHGVARRTVTTSTLTGTLAGLAAGVDLAVVFDGVDEDVAELFEAIRHRGVGTPVVIVSESDDPDDAARALESGASGVLPARCAVDDLCGALVSVSHGHVVVAGEMRAAVLETLRRRRVQQREARIRLAALSRVDLDILRLLCDGMTVTRIAARLSLSPHTVRGRVRIIGAQLGVAGQLRVAAVGRRLLAAARLPAGGSGGHGPTPRPAPGTRAAVVSARESAEGHGARRRSA